MANQATVDPGACVIMLGTYTLTGFATDVGYTSSMRDTRWTATVGNRGLAARGKTVSGLATITLNILNTSVDNDFLSAMAELDDKTPGGFLVPLSKVTMNARIVENGLVYVTKVPDTQDGVGPYPVVWTLESMNFVKFVGGHLGPKIESPGTLEALQALIAKAPGIPSAS